MEDLHVVLVHHGVVHGGVYSRMTEQLLHLLDGHPLVNRMGGQGAAELVGMDATDAAGLAEISQAGFDAANAEACRRCVQRDEQRGAIVGAGVEIRLQVQLGAGVEVDWALLVSLAGDNALALLQVDVGYIEADELSNEHASGGEHIHDGKVADVRATIAQRLEVFVGQDLFGYRSSLNLVDAPDRALHDVILVF